MTDLGLWLNDLIARAESHQDGIEDAWLHLEKSGYLSRVVVHRYICSGGCGVLATVADIGGAIVLRTRDYKPSPGLNRGRSVETARQRNTLDGERHWPSYLIDLRRDAGDPAANIEVVCKHGPKRIEYDHALERAREATPGKPGKPTLL